MQIDTAQTGTAQTGTAQKATTHSGNPGTWKKPRLQLQVQLYQSFKGLLISKRWRTVHRMQRKEFIFVKILPGSTESSERKRFLSHQRHCLYVQNATLFIMFTECHVACVHDAFNIALAELRLKC